MLSTAILALNVTVKMMYLKNKCFGFWGTLSFRPLTRALSLEPTGRWETRGLPCHRSATLDPSSQQKLLPCLWQGVVKTRAVLNALQPVATGGLRGQRASSYVE